MIDHNPIVDELITKLITKYEASGSNTDRKANLFIKEALALQKTAPFLDINSYLYFLSEMSVLLLQLNNGDYATFYGLDDWEEGLNILDSPIPEKNGFHLVLDICNTDGDILYFSYNTNNPKEDILWISDNVEDGPYQKTDISFTAILRLIYEDQYQSLNEQIR